MADTNEDGFVADDDDGFVPDAHVIAAPKGDVNVPPVAPAPADDENAHPSWLASAIRGFGEGVGIAPIARRFTAAGRTVLPNALGGTDRTYDQNLADEEDRAYGAATDHPLTYAPTKIAGAITGALRLSPAAFATLSGGNAALETDGGVIDKAKAAALAVGTAFVLGKLGRSTTLARTGANLPSSFVPGAGAATRAVSRVVSSPWTLPLVGVAGAVRAATDSNLPAGDRIADTVLGVLPTAAHLVSANARRAAKFEEPRQSAIEDTREVIQREGMERTAQEDAAVADVERQRTRTEQQNAARTDAATSADKQEFDAGRKDDRLSIQNDFDRQNTANDRQTKVRNDAVTKHREEKQAEDRAHRLSALDYKDEFAKKMKAYEEQKADADAFVEEERARGGETAARVARFKALRVATESLRAAHVKEGDAIRAKMEELKGRKVDAAASAQAYFDGLHRELYDRATRHIAGSEALGQEPDSDIVASLRYLHSKHESLSPEKFAQLDEYADPETHAEALRKETAKRADATDAEMQGLSDRLNEHGSPDFHAEAQKQIDAKETAKRSLEEEAKTAIAAEDAAAGRAPLRAAPPTPIKPDMSAHDQTNRDFARAKLEQPAFVPPPKPDTTGTRIQQREARADIRNAPGFDPAQSHGRTDRGLLLDKRAPITPNDSIGSPAAYLMKKLDLGRQNVQKDLDLARTTKHGVSATPGEQFVRESRSEVPGKAAKIVGGFVLGGLTGDPFLAGAGAHLGSKLADKAPESIVSRWLSTTKDATGKLRFSDPAEAHAVLDAAQKHLIDTSTLTTEQAHAIEAFAAFGSHERKRKEHAP